MVRLEEETRTNQYIVAERLPKEVDTRKKTLLDLQKVVAEPAMGQSDLEKLHQQVRRCYTCTGNGKLLEDYLVITGPWKLLHCSSNFILKNQF